MYLFRVTGPSLIHLLVHRSCVCSCTTGPSVRRCSAVGLSAGVVVTGPWFVHRSSIYWSRGHWSVVRASLVHLLESSLPCHLAPLGTVFASVRLFGCSTVRFYTPLVLTSFCSAARLYSPCAHSYSICWLSLAATLFTHSVPHVMSRQWVITHSLSHVLESFERRSGS